MEFLDSCELYIVGADIIRPVKIGMILTNLKRIIERLSHFASQNGRADNIRPYETNESINSNLDIYAHLRTEKIPRCTAL